MLYRYKFTEFRRRVYSRLIIQELRKLQDKKMSEHSGKKITHSDGRDEGELRQIFYSMGLILIVFFIL